MVVEQHWGRSPLSSQWMRKQGQITRGRERKNGASKTKRERGRKGKMLEKKSENDNETKFVGGGERKNDINTRGRQSESFDRKRVRAWVVFARGRRCKTHNSSQMKL